MARRESLSSGFASASFSSFMAFLKCGGMDAFHSSMRTEYALFNESMHALYSALLYISCACSDDVKTTPASETMMGIRICLFILNL